MFCGIGSAGCGVQPARRSGRNPTWRVAQLAWRPYRIPLYEASGWSGFGKLKGGDNEGGVWATRSGRQVCTFELPPEHVIPDQATDGSTRPAHVGGGIGGPIVNTGRPLYLSSLESYRFEPVRKCRLVRLIRFDTGKPCALVSLHPGVSGQDFGVPGDLDTLILATRHEGASLAPIREFPCFVYIGIPSLHWDSSRDEISSDHVQIIAWGELYASAEDAARHSFGQP